MTLPKGPKNVLTDIATNRENHRYLGRKIRPAERDKTPDTDQKNLPGFERCVVIGYTPYTAIILRLCYLQISTPEYSFHRISGGSSNAAPGIPGANLLVNGQWTLSPGLIL